MALFADVSSPHFFPLVTPGSNASAPPQTPDELKGLNVSELRAEARRRGLRAGGRRKAELVALLAEAMGESGSEPAAAAAEGAAGEVSRPSEKDGQLPSQVGARTETGTVEIGGGGQAAAQAAGADAATGEVAGGWQRASAAVEERYRERSGQVQQVGRYEHLEIPTGMELCFLGTSGGAPTLRRSVSCYALNMPTKSWMVDCGEGSQLRLMQSSSVKLNKIDRIFVTHLHGDHIFGLPGLICGLSAIQCQEQQSKRTPLRLYGPKGLATFVRAAMATSYTRLSMPVIVTELVDEVQAQGLSNEGRSGNKDGTIVVRELVGRISSEAAARMPQRRPQRADQAWRTPFEHGLEWDVCEDAEMGISVKAAPLKHAVPCIGYAFVEESRRGRFNPDAAKAMGLPPGPLFKQLTRGESVEFEGRTIRPEDVLSRPRKGRKVVVLGDTYDPRGISHIAEGCDLLVHEATFADAVSSDGGQVDYNEARQAVKDATRKGHSTAGMAGRFAAEIKAQHLVLTHFSARFGAPPEQLAAPVSEAGADDRVGEGDSPAILDERHVGLLRAQAQRAFGQGRIWCANDWDRFMLSRHEGGE